MTSIPVHKNKFFGAFIMTYERTEILKESIENLKSQSFPPEVILIVDNSESHTTENFINGLNDSIIQYYRVGYNSGPAGAAKIGLAKLAEQRYQWIYWGDDDNPPVNQTFFEHLFKKIERNSANSKYPIGIIGGRGGNLNRFTGRIRTLSNRQLQKGPLIEVDCVAGGHTMLVNALVVQNNVLPEEKLFFGFEELDFCLRVQENGFKVVTDTEEWLKSHFRLGNLSPSYRWRGSSFGNPEALWRSYYSSRNLLFLFKDHFFPIPLFILFFKTIFKSFAGYRYGMSYGKKNFLIQWQAISDFLKGNFGKSSVLPKLLGKSG